MNKHLNIVHRFSFAGTIPLVDLCDTRVDFGIGADVLFCWVGVGVCIGGVLFCWVGVSLQTSSLTGVAVE